jgi:hypothetical protein
LVDSKSQLGASIISDNKNATNGNLESTMGNKHFTNVATQGLLQYHNHTTENNLQQTMPASMGGQNSFGERNPAFGQNFAGDFCSGTNEFSKNFSDHKNSPLAREFESRQQKSGQQDSKIGPLAENLMMMMNSDQQQKSDESRDYREKIFHSYQSKPNINLTH